jgi:hypothetical protein
MNQSTPSSKPSDEIDVDQLLAGLRDLSKAFVDGRQDSYRMRIPAEPYRDGDLVCGSAARLIERLQQQLQRINDLSVHLSSGGKPDEPAYTRADVHALIGVIRALEEQKRTAVETPEGRNEVAKLHSAFQNVMSHLSDWLDDDKFNNIEAMVIAAGVPFPPLQRAEKTADETPAAREEPPDIVRLNWLEEECAELRCKSQSYGDDADVYYEVWKFYMSAPCERPVGRGSTPREAIDAAMDNDDDECCYCGHERNCNVCSPVKTPAAQCTCDADCWNPNCIAHGPTVRAAEKSNEYTKVREVMNPPESAAQGSEARNLTSANVMGLEQVHRATEAGPVEVAPLPNYILEVGLSENLREVILNHPEMTPTPGGVGGHIIFSPLQARALGALLIRKAFECVGGDTCAL